MSIEESITPVSTGSICPRSGADVSENSAELTQTVFEFDYTSLVYVNIIVQTCHLFQGRRLIPRQFGWVSAGIGTAAALNELGQELISGTEKQPELVEEEWPKMVASRELGTAPD